MTPLTRDFHVGRQGQHAEPSASSVGSSTEELKGMPLAVWARVGQRTSVISSRRNGVCLGMEEAWNNLGEGPTK